MSLRPVELVPASEIAPERVAPWFDVAWADMYGPEQPASIPAVTDWLRGAADAQRRVVLIDDQPAGIVAFGVRDGLLELTALAIAPPRRNEGAGAEVVWLLEQGSGAARARAYFPQANGYAFYFWLRAGYCPIFLADHGRAGLNAVGRDLR